MSEKAEQVQKWFKSGPIADINTKTWRVMDPDHRYLYNLHRRKQDLEAQLESVQAEIKELSEKIIETLKSDPSAPQSKWSWVEIMYQTKPKWKEIALALNPTKAVQLAKEYAQKQYPFLRIKYIHPDKD